MTISKLISPIVKHDYCGTEMSPKLRTSFRQTEIDQDYFCSKCSLVVHVTRPLTEEEKEFRLNWETMLLKFLK